MNDFDEFERDLLQMCADIKNGNEVKKHLRKEASKLSRKQKKEIKKSTKKHTGNLLKGSKKGKPYKYEGEWSIRAYNNAPHAHLVDKGHIIVDKNGVEKGFQPGVNFMEKAEKGFQEEHFNNTQKFIDEMLDKRNL